MNWSDEREAFHAAVWKRPDDDLPRLVYADWLDEHNEPDAAAFLRLLSAVRACPPDVDKLRPLVADLRRAMVKVPPAWVEAVCPVPPAVVVGPWVDVDHDANAGVLSFIRQRRRARTGVMPPGDLIPLRPEQEVRWPSQQVVDRLWGDLQPELSPAAACAIDGVPALVDVWSGVVMAVAAGEDGYALRVDRPTATRVEQRGAARGVVRNQMINGRIVNAQRLFGPDWAFGAFSTFDLIWLQRAAAVFDPANGGG